MDIHKKELGKRGEEIGCEYLKKIGYEILERNFTCRQGEIDMIAKDKAEYVFVEVKTRSNVNYGRPVDAVNGFKQKHMYESARYYLHIHQKDSTFVRFDVIEIYWLKNSYKLRHLKGIEINFWH